MKCYRKAIELDPKNLEAFNLLGNAFYTNRELDEAIRCYKQAIMINPNHEDAYMGLGNAY